MRRACCSVISCAMKEKGSCIELNGATTSPCAGRRARSSNDGGPSSATFASTCVQTFVFFREKVFSATGPNRVHWMRVPAPYRQTALAAPRRGCGSSLFQRWYGPVGQSPPLLACDQQGNGQSHVHGTPTRQALDGSARWWHGTPILPVTGVR
jgi:hypothetical protein